MANADRKPVKSPVTLERKGFEAFVADVGAAYVSGQPTADALRELKKEGFTTVVCVRTQEELDDRSEVPFDEPALLKELGMTYVHIPMGPCDPEKVAEFTRAVNESKGKVLLHCTVGWRATYMWMAYLVTDRKYSIDDAWRDGMNMSVTVDRSELMLANPVSYTAVPHKDGARTPKQGVISKPGSHLTITSPKVVNPITDDHTAFVMWDLGGILNASQPDEKKLRELAGEGVKTVVNLRGPQEMEMVKKNGFDEEAVCKELGLDYVSIPITGYQTFTPEALDKIGAAFENAKGKVLYHCQSANRTTLALVPYLVKFQGLSLDEATKVGEAMRWNNMLAQLLGMDMTYTLKPKQ
ncbi:MAG: dual specificity protein phosphatase family protein [Armatimonadetes bacterium]|nr:dual specificity protein phosphatase family protein [Armatimonadota bacterium]